MQDGRIKLRGRNDWYRGETGWKAEKVLYERVCCDVVETERGRKYVIVECGRVDQWCMEEI